MYFRFSLRHNPAKGKSDAYYRLIESYRNEKDRVCHRTLLNVGFLDELQCGLRQRVDNSGTIVNNNSKFVDYKNIFQIILGTRMADTLSNALRSIYGQAVRGYKFHTVLYG
jgi:hypothetical protein